MRKYQRQQTPGHQVTRGKGKDVAVTGVFLEMLKLANQYEEQVLNSKKYSKDAKFFTVLSLNILRREIKLANTDCKKALKFT